MAAVLLCASASSGRKFILSRTVQQKSYARRLALLSATTVLVSSLGVLAAPQASAAEGVDCSGGAVQIVAHEDDDLLFQSPDLLHDIDEGRCVRTVYVTAGDSGDVEEYWLSREQGSEAALAQMAGVADSWTTGEVSLAGNPVRLRTLDASPNVSVVFMRLPDGFPLGTGSAARGYQSLYRLLNGAIPTITAVDGSASYTADTLRDALLDAIRDQESTWVRAQDYLTAYGNDGDHYDHHAVAYLTRDASDAYSRDHILGSYLGYGDFMLDENWPQNVFGDDLDRKISAFATYAEHDIAIDWDGYWNTGWLHRQYVIATDGSPVAANAGIDRTVTAGTSVSLDGNGSSGLDDLSYSWTQIAGPAVELSGADTAAPSFAAIEAGDYAFELTVSDGQATSTDSVTVTMAAAPLTNVARQSGVRVTQSSEVAGQEGVKAIDGVVDGYPGSWSNEWSSDGDGVGAWVRLTWDGPVTLSRVVLFDRPNGNDQITGGTLVFSDGSSVPVTSLANDGSATTITFPARAVTSVRLDVSSVSASTERAGLAEFEAWGTPGGSAANRPPVANAGADSSDAVGTLVRLDGSASSDPDAADSLTYAWTQTAGPAVELSGADTAAPSFTPVQSGDYVFELAVSDGRESSTDSVAVSVGDDSWTPTNVARQSGVRVTQSSEVVGQEGVKAIDGVVDGYPGSWSNEWSSDGDGVGAWVRLTWDGPVTLSRVVLFDRPNGNDQITGGTLVFSDGSSVPVTSLANDGSATTITFPARAVTSVRLDVSSVSASTERAGLAEFEAWGMPGGNR